MQRFMTCDRLHTRYSKAQVRPHHAVAAGTVYYSVLLTHAGENPAEVSDAYASRGYADLLACDPLSRLRLPNGRQLRTKSREVCLSPIISLLELSEYHRVLDRPIVCEQEGLAQDDR